MRNILEQGQDTLDHQIAVDADNLLVQAYDVGQEGQGFNLGAHEVNKHFSVEVLMESLNLIGLKCDGCHDKRDKFRHLLVHVLFV